METYFNKGQIKQIKQVLPENFGENVKENEEYGQSYARSIIKELDLSKIKLEKGICYICKNASITTVDYNAIWKMDYARVASDIKAELEKLVGYKAVVKFELSETWEQEPDPIPPLYMGAMETVYLLSLTIYLLGEPTRKKRTPKKNNT